VEGNILILNYFSVHSMQNLILNMLT